MAWRHGAWTVEHALPFGATERAEVGRQVIAGDILASGSALGPEVIVPGARRLGVSVDDLGLARRVLVGADVARGTVLARTRRRFGRSCVSPVEGRLVHLTAEGDFVVSQVLEPWLARSTLDGTVVRSDAAAVTVEGTAWCLPGLAGYGPDAIGELTVAVDAPMDELAPSRIDIRVRGAILIGGARMAAEAITRAHACGAAGVVAGAAPAGGLRVVYGDDVTADGSPSRDDRPTVLCLVGFGTGALPLEVFRPLLALAGARAAIHTASARLFVFAAADAVSGGDAPAIALADDHAGVRPLTSPGELAGVVRFPSEVEAEALMTETGPVPVANVRPFDARR